MFGEFAAAQAFHDAVRAAHTQHLKALQANREVLSAIGSNAHRAATAFSAMDARNAAAEQAVRNT
jgi:hypothetical protein